MATPLPLAPPVAPTTPQCQCGKPYSACSWGGTNVKFQVRPGQIILTEGGRTDFVSSAIRWATGSRLTHCFIVTGRDEMVEAYVPRVRKYSLEARLRELEQENRAYYLLDLPGITLQQRCRLVERARHYVGRFYDVGQALFFGLARRFTGHDGAGTLICSRLITAVFKEALDVDLFTTAMIEPSDTRRAQLAAGECTPNDLLRSKLRVLRFIPSKTMPFQ
jgi:uncharacterized protein YycO